MKRAVSISIGSSKRNKATEIELLGQRVCLERIGTDGNMAAATRLFGELDGVVDAFGMGGTDLGLLIGDRWYPLHSIRSLVRLVHKTPIVDGNGLKVTLERMSAPTLENSWSAYLDQEGRRVLIVAGVDRYGMATSFVDAGYECLFGDLMFTFGLPIALHNMKSLRRLARVLMPIASRLPFSWVYPTGEKQEKRTPKWPDQFAWCTVIAGDCHFIKRYMPDRLQGKIIVTNTTTPKDVEEFRQAGVKLLVTTTPVLDGRSFGTNMMEAAILAACGRKEPVDYAHAGPYLEWINSLLPSLHFQPQIQELN